MFRSIAALTLACTAACNSRGIDTVPVDEVTLAIQEVNVVPMDGDRVLRDRTVLVAGDRIVWIGGGGVSLPSSARVVDGRGRYLIPGLWDMHVHTLGNADAFFPLFLAHGVTGVRDMGGFVDSLLAVRERLRSGALAGPRLMAAGPLLEGPRHRWSHAIALHLDSPDQARESVNALAEVDVDFLKVYSAVSKDVYLALVRTARERALPFAGHIPFAISAGEASDAGQASLEHAGLDVTSLDCVRDGGTRFRTLLGIWGFEGYEAYLRGMLALRSERDQDCVEALYGRYRENATWVTPTIVNAIKDSASLTWDALSYLSTQDRMACRATVRSFEEASDEVRRRWHRAFLDDVAALHHAGVSLLAGTDVPNPCVVPGASIHDELEWLVRAGLTPYEALKSATVNPAVFFGSDSIGVIRPGLLADMVLLDENPLDDIRATRAVTAVVLGGRYFDSAALNRGLERGGR